MYLLRSLQTVAFDRVKLSKLVNWVVLGCSLKCLIA